MNCNQFGGLGLVNYHQICATIAWYLALITTTRGHQGANIVLVRGNLIPWYDLIINNNHFSL